MPCHTPAPSDEEKFHHGWADEEGKKEAHARLASKYLCELLTDLEKFSTGKIPQLEIKKYWMEWWQYHKDMPECSHNPGFKEWYKKDMKERGW